jgi:glycosyltransferase involved in cell wall biosynthesis
LHYALQGTLRQTFNDFEIIVSDNNSTDSTKAVVDALADARVRYVNTGRDLDIAESWNFALSHAAGEYVLLHGDDDCLIPDALAIYNKVLEKHLECEIISLANAWYGHHTVWNSKWKNALCLPNIRVSRARVSTHELLRTYFSLSLPVFSPTWLLVSRKVLECVRNEYQDVYMTPYPDYSALALFLVCADTLVYLDYPTVLHGYSRESSARFYWASTEQNKSLIEDNQDWKGLFQYTQVPLHGAFFVNGWAESLVRATKASPTLKAGAELDWERYFVAYRLEMWRAGQVRDVSEEKEEYRRALRERSILFRLKVLRAVFPRLFVCSVSSRLRFNPARLKGLLKGPIDKFLGRTSAAQWRSEEWLPGEKWGFSNIVECAARLEHIYGHMRTQDSSLDGEGS